MKLGLPMSGIYGRNVLERKYKSFGNLTMERGSESLLFKKERDNYEYHYN